MSDDIRAAEIVIENHELRRDHEHGALHDRVLALESELIAARAELAAHEAIYHAPEPEPEAEAEPEEVVDELEAAQEAALEEAAEEEAAEPPPAADLAPEVRHPLMYRVIGRR